MTIPAEMSSDTVVHFTNAHGATTVEVKPGRIAVHHDLLFEMREVEALILTLRKAAEMARLR